MSEPENNRDGFAALCRLRSLIVPGLGQIVGRQAQRGLIILGSVASIVGIFAWRVAEPARREATAWDMFVRAFERRGLFVGLVVGGILLMWLLNVWDAWRVASSGRKGRPGVFVLIGAVFFVLGWQISEISLVKMVAELPDAGPLLARVLWPWEAAITYESDTLSAGAKIHIGKPGEEPAPEQPESTPGEPRLEVDPLVGELSVIDEQGNVVPGTPSSRRCGWASVRLPGLWRSRSTR